MFANHLVPSLSQVDVCTLAPLTSHTCRLGHSKQQDGCQNWNIHIYIYISNIFIPCSVFPSYLFWTDKTDPIIVIQRRQCNLIKPVTTSLKDWERVKLPSHKTVLLTAGYCTLVTMLNLTKNFSPMRRVCQFS